VTMPLVEPGPKGPKFARVIKTEEKGSDVNIAAHLLNDAYKHMLDAAVIVTNDSDLVEPIRIARDELRLPVGILNPHRHNASRLLLKHASFVRQIREGALKACQFPPTLSDEHGLIHKPRVW
jgi:NYN domain